MKILVVVKKNIIDGKSKLKALQSILDKKKVVYQIVGYDEVEEFYNEIHKRDFKNTFSLLLSFGGDGTILKSARIARKLDIPILGVNVGNIGFLTTISNIFDVNFAIDNIKKKNYFLEERSMIETDVIRNGKKIFKAYAVNETTIATSILSKIGKYKILIGKEKDLFSELSADGVIIATPTGSTAHSLSAGGPIVLTDIGCLIITALYPHTLNQRSFVVNDSKTIYVEILTDNQVVDIDGRISFELEKEDIISINRLRRTVKYITFKKNNFLNNIKEKIKAL